jgi:hypothetical protein
MDVVVHDAVVIDENTEENLVSEQQKVEHALYKGISEEKVTIVATSGQVNGCRAVTEYSPGVPCCEVKQSPCPMVPNL